MDLEAAPLFTDVAPGPQDGTAYWVKAADGKRLRVAYWPAPNARGTLLLMPGRTEYVEKYGATARVMAERGIATLTIDWRGQGLADRLLADKRVGHIGTFSDYQLDVTAMMEVARHVGAPEPFVLLGHSMGGGIGLRAIYEGLPVVGAVFTGPMWGIYFSRIMRPAVWLLPRIATVLGMGTLLPPTTSYDSYVLANPFEDNMLTRDPDFFAMMQRQLEAHPELQLGGPSMIWVKEATAECLSLVKEPSPNLPCVTYLGANERIIDCDAVRNRMNRWSRGELVIVPESEHELLMEVPDTREKVHQSISDMFAPHQMMSKSA